MKNLDIYDALVAKCPRIERKGKTVTYTSSNGYMFSLLNKDGEIGIRLSKEKLMQKHNTTLYKSHNAIMKGYILIPNSLHKELDLLAESLN